MSFRVTRRVLPILALTTLAALVVGLAAWWLWPSPEQGRGEADSGALPVERARPTGPNIVLLILDTLRADRVGAYADDLPPGLSTALDDLASEGVRFERAISQSSWTRPSIGSFLTSQYPRTLGIYEEQGDALADRFVTLAEALKSGGYRTIGLTANPNLNRAFNFQQGFDEYVESWVVWRWMAPEPGQSTEREVSLPSATDLFDRALALIEEDPSATSYVQLDLMEVHEHMHPEAMVRPELRDLYRDHPESGYLQSIHQLSHDVGEFVAQVRALPGWEETLFVIVSDHGEGLGSHPHVERSTFHGHVLYESQNWVPLIFAGGGGALPSGRVVERPVRLLDLMPTLLDYAGVEAREGMEGISLRPLVDDPSATVALPEYFVVETQFRGNDKVGVYGGELKLIENVIPHLGTEPVEVQPNRIYEDGFLTDVGRTEGEESARMRAYLDAWVSEHPRAARTVTETGPSAGEVEQLRAIGYAQ